MENPLRPSFKTEIIPLVFIAVSLVLSFYFYAHFPERVVTHWGINGEPNGWSGRGFAAFFFPLFNLAIYLLLLVLPSLDPKKKNYETFRSAYHVIKAVLVVFLSLLYLAVGASGLGFAVSVSTVVPLGIGALFVVIGYYLNHIKQNWFLGIRTPWTLSSETVWQKTHLFGSRIFMLSGLILALSGFWPSWFWVFMIVIIFMVLGTFVYSYFVYKKERQG